jgi:hypothetical protein
MLLSGVCDFKLVRTPGAGNANRNDSSHNPHRHLDDDDHRHHNSHRGNKPNPDNYRYLYIHSRYDPNGIGGICDPNPYPNPHGIGHTDIHIYFYRNANFHPASADRYSNGHPGTPYGH